MKKLDKFDIEITKLLIENSRYPLSYLSEMVRRSKSFVDYRIKKLEKIGAFNYTVAVRWKKIGFQSFRILAKGIERIKIPRIFGMRNYSVFYNYYDILILSYDLRNIKYIINYLKESGFEVELFIRDKIVIPYNFLEVKMKEFKEDKEIDVDKNFFWNFIKVYEKNLRKPLIYLSKILNIDYIKLRNIIKEYERSIIRGYSININPEIYGYKRAVIYLSIKKNKEFIKEINKIRVNNMEKLVGRMDYRIEYFYKDERDLRKIIDRLEDMYVKDMQILK
ncbi:MAG: hypothetical protein ACP5GJ_00055 [Nanopusillaceae archaeon]